MKPCTGLEREVMLAARKVKVSEASKLCMAKKELGMEIRHLREMEDLRDFIGIYKVLENNK